MSKKTELKINRLSIDAATTLEKAASIIYLKMMQLDIENNIILTGNLSIDKLDKLKRVLACSLNSIDKSKKITIISKESINQSSQTIIESPTFQAIVLVASSDASEFQTIKKDIAFYQDLKVPILGIILDNSK